MNQTRIPSHALLVSAAPDLLAICQEIEEHFDNIADGVKDAGYADKMAAYFLTPLRAAIAKATGGAQ